MRIVQNITKRCEYEVEMDIDEQFVREFVADYKREFLEEIKVDAIVYEFLDHMTVEQFCDFLLGKEEYEFLGNRDGFSHTYYLDSDIREYCEEVFSEEPETLIDQNYESSYFYQGGLTICI